MSTWLNRGASGGRCGGLKREQPNSHGVLEILCVRRFSEVAVAWKFLLSSGPAKLPEAPRLSHVFMVQPFSSWAAVGGLGEAIFVQYRELVHRHLPGVGRSAPVGRDVAQRQPDQLGGRIVAGEVAPGS
jgi:hypothetical protein